MESRAFIHQANYLINRIRQEDERTQEMQVEINRMFNALQNPSLISASVLRQTCLDAGYDVPNVASQRIAFMDKVLG